MKLKNIQMTIVWITVCLFIILALSLIIFSSYLKNDAVKINNSLYNIYYAEKLAKNVLLHHHETFLYKKDHQFIHKQKKEAIEQVILSTMRALKNEKIIHHMESSINEYLTSNRKLEIVTQNPLIFYKQKNLIIDKTIKSINAFINLNLIHSQNFMKEIEQRNTEADLWAGLCIFFSLVLMTLFFITIVKLIYIPLTQIEKAISLYSDGKLTTINLGHGAFEIQNIAHTFNQMAQKLEEKRQFQIRFLAAIAHDLNNPLTAIRISTELLLLKNSYDQEIKKRISAIFNQTKILERIVGDLLDTTKIEVGQFGFKKALYDLCLLIKNSIQLYETSSSIHQFKLQLPECPLLSYCDPDRISQVLNNLLSNAIKYSPYGGDIGVQLYLNKQIFITVSDSGIGIRQEDIPKIFEPFHRTSLTRNTIPGLGLGLSIVKKIIEAHHGSIEVESKSGEGTKFIIILPIQTADNLT